MYHIKPFSKNYTKELCELNKSLVPTWYRDLLSSTKSQASWEDLSHLERFLHGGPWMDPVCLEIHLKYFLKFGEILLLFDDQQQLVGELEYHQWENSIHIDWMMIHPQYQKRGLGKRLIDNISEKYLEIWTEPEDGVEEFYFKCGFEIETPVFYRYTFRGQAKHCFDPIAEVPDLHDWNQGDETNDRLYLDLLINSNLAYSELFGYPFPVRYIELDNGLVVIRELPGLRNKYAIFISSQEKLERDEFVKKIRYGINELGKNEIAVVTTIGETFTNYFNLTKILRLRKRA